VLLDYIAEVEHAGTRIGRLEQALNQALTTVPKKLRAVIEGLQALRGVAQLSALTIVAEVGELSRFVQARQLMAYSGLIPSEHSSGEKIRRGAITKTGNTHLRRVLVEAAWCYRHPPAIGPTLRGRQERVSEEVKAIAWKAQQRLCGRYRRFITRGKPAAKVATMVARELLGFVWAIGIHLEGCGRAPAVRPSASRPSAGQRGARRPDARLVVKPFNDIHPARPNRSAQNNDIDHR